MRSILGKPKRLATDDSGTTMTEYSLLLLFVVLVAAVVLAILGQNVLPLYNVSQYLWNLETSP